MRNFQFYNISSDNFFKKYKNELFDIIYIDGGHDRIDVISDGKNSFKILKRGGILIFDDFLYEYNNKKKIRKKIESDFVIGGILLFLSKFEKIEILYVGHQIILRKK